MTIFPHDKNCEFAKDASNPFRGEYEPVDSCTCNTPQKEECLSCNNTNKDCPSCFCEKLIEESKDKKEQPCSWCHDDQGPCPVCHDSKFAQQEISITVEKLKRILEHIKNIEVSNKSWRESPHKFHEGPTHGPRPYPWFLCSNCKEREKSREFDPILEINSLRKELKESKDLCAKLSDKLSEKDSNESRR